MLWRNRMPRGIDAPDSGTAERQRSVHRACQPAQCVTTSVVPRDGDVGCPHIHGGRLRQTLPFPIEDEIPATSEELSPKSRDGGGNGWQSRPPGWRVCRRLIVDCDRNKQVPRGMTSAGVRFGATADHSYNSVLNVRRA